MSTDTKEVDLSTASDDDLKAMGLPPRFTLDDLKSFMTEEELERELKSADPLVKPPEDKGDEEDDDDEDDEDAGKADATAPAEADDKAKAPPTDEPTIRQIDVSQHQAVIDGIKDERAKLRTAYEDGDLTDAEFDEKMDALADTLADAKAAVKDAERIREADIAAYRQSWYSKTAQIMEATPAFKDMTPVPQLDGYSVAQLFDQACRHVTGDPKFAHLSQAGKLAQAETIARDFYKQRTGADLPSTKSAKPAKQEKTAADMVREQGQKPKPVQTLGGLTTASETDVENSRFAAIDSAKGLDAERAYASMSAAEKEAYLAGM